ncbi:hypothetical protein XA68_12815 [Ophiocordyceps unilateralis]|uniref:AB hydrolase-1 domain-containing protein n=1 Tax=Ophiocordyceps unilateralis TaxID=268505 RepID=A0A2A9PDZ6_OPHUN|nr:hypothetical protein XA68_12815 [Ophiocordyceps unilateralis]
MLQTVHFSVKEHIVPGCHIREYPGISSGRQEEYMYLHVKQYTPLDQAPRLEDSAMTLIAMHGIGLPKELYEPLWDELYDQSRTHGYSIRGIWIADMAHMGTSSMINEKNMSMDSSWMDHARDVLHMINHFRNEMPRPLIGLGHSCGGLQLVNLAYIHPRLFTSLLLLDPAFFLTKTGKDIIKGGGLRETMYGKDLWKTRTDAASFIEKAYPSWDQGVKRLMVKYGFRDLPTALYPELPPDADPANPPVTLMTTKHQMALTLSRPCFDCKQVDGRIVVDRETHADLDPERVTMPGYRPEVFPSMERIQTLRPSALFLLGKHTNTPWLDGMRRAADVAGTGVGGSGGKPEGRTREVLIRGGHYFPFTALEETSLACGTWLGEEMAKYRDRERRWKNERSKLSERDHLVLPAKWKEFIRPPDVISSKL